MSGSVLIVDDVATNRVVLKAKLAKACYDTLQAGDGESALRIARAEQPAMILLDLMLPDIGGIEVCRRLRADPATREIPVIVVTSVDDSASRMEALRVGADDFLSKPVDELILMARMRSLLRARQTADELRLRDGAGETAGFAEGAETFEAPGRIALVAGARETAFRWRRALCGRMSHAVMVLSRTEVLTHATEERCVPDLYVVEADLEGRGDGLQLMAELRARVGTRNVGISIVLDPGDRDTGAMALDLGANDLLTSDFDPDETTLRLATQLRRKRQADRLHSALHDELRLAVTDPLTGLHNRRHATPQLARIAARARRTGQRFAVMMLDIDRFKSVNDRLGHAAGDTVLVEVARRLRAALRPVDMLARIGGEEFLVAMPDINLGAARLAAERLRHAIECDPVSLPALGESVRITVSIGLIQGDGSAPDAQHWVERLTERADRALRGAKSEGRNQVTVGGAAA